MTVNYSGPYDSNFSSSTTSSNHVSSTVYSNDLQAICCFWKIIENAIIPEWLLGHLHFTFLSIVNSIDLWTIRSYNIDSNLCQDKLEFQLCKSSPYHSTLLGHVQMATLQMHDHELVHCLSSISLDQTFQDLKRARVSSLPAQ